MKSDEHESTHYKCLHSGTGRILFAISRTDSGGDVWYLRKNIKLSVAVHTVILMWDVKARGPKVESHLGIKNKILLKQLPAPHKRTIIACVEDLHPAAEKLHEELQKLYIIHHLYEF